MVDLGFRRPFSVHFFETTTQMSAWVALLADQQDVAKRHDVIACQFKIYKWPLKLDSVWPLGTDI